MNRLRRAVNTGYVAALAWRERRIPYWPLQRIEALQRRRLQAIVRYAYETVPFYRRAMDDLGLRPADFQTADDLARLPLLDAGVVRADLEQFTSTRCGATSRQPFYSGGTHSGVRRLIYWDNASLLQELALRERDRTVMNRLAGRGWGQRQLFILPKESLTFKLREFWGASTLIPPSVARREFVPSQLPMEAIAERLSAVRPDVVFSYGSYAEQFARFAADRQLAVAAHVWVYGADAPSPAGKALVERTLGCTVYSTYQTVETWRLGFQCELCRGFHLNVDRTAVRLIDEQGQTLGPGKVGEVVISGLCNRGTVLLNYRLGDLGVLASEPCRCGRSLPLLDHLEGRHDEMLTLPGGRQILSAVLEVGCEPELERTLAAQIAQPGPGQICWRVVPCASADPEALRAALLARTHALLGADVPVQVDLLPEIPRTPQGKFRRVVPYTPDEGSRP